MSKEQDIKPLAGPSDKESLKEGAHAQLPIAITHSGLESLSKILTKLKSLKSTATNASLDPLEVCGV